VCIYNSTKETVKQGALYCAKKKQKAGFKLEVYLTPFWCKAKSIGSNNMSAI